MSSNQYKYTGIRIDNGQQITGYLCRNFNNGYSIMPEAFFASVIAHEEEPDDDDECSDDDYVDSGLAIGGFFDVHPESVQPADISLDELKNQNLVNWAKRLLTEVDKDYNGLKYQNRLNDNGLKYHEDVKAFLKSCE